MGTAPAAAGPVPRLAGESTGSFVNRLAHAHELELGDLLDRVEWAANRSILVCRPWRSCMSTGRHWIIWRCCPARTPHRLQLALTNLQARFPLPGDDPARWQWPFEVREGHVVGAAATCAPLPGAWVRRRG